MGDTRAFGAGGSSARQELQGSIRLWLEKDRDNETDERAEKFVIRQTIGEGSSAICYDAIRYTAEGGEEIGKLKEYYPLGEVRRLGLRRGADNQLTVPSGYRVELRELAQRYAGSYQVIEKSLSRDLLSREERALSQEERDRREVIRNYFQSGQLYCGRLEDGSEGTAYIWSTGIAGRNFEDYLDEVRRDPAKDARRHLEEILDACQSLADSIRSLHMAGLLHMDIKPGNFLLAYDSDLKLRPGHISHFDINTICLINEAQDWAAGTRGYCAPEVRNPSRWSRIGVRSDVFSIGAVLFHALVIPRDEKYREEEEVYRGAYYESLPLMVRDSVLLQEAHVDTVMVSLLCGILQKSLADQPRDRYADCGELRDAIGEARERLRKLSYRPPEGLAPGEAVNPMMVIQKLLYQHPLLPAEDLGEGEKEKILDVLCIGAETFGQRFIDVCLQVGQMAGTRIRITVVSENPQRDRENYLRLRPAMPEFVRITGGERTDEEASSALSPEKAWAFLEFHAVTELAGGGSSESLRFSQDPKNNERTVRNLIALFTRAGREIRYVFVDQGEEQVSRPIAAVAARELSFSCPVCYVSERVSAAEGTEEPKESGLIPVLVNQPVDVRKEGEQLGEMAFNAHLCWNDTLNLDLDKERRKFFHSEERVDVYNFISSLTNVLSIRYKLYSIGIPYDPKKPQEGAEAFRRQVLDRMDTDEGARRDFDQMLDLEHRRWVLEHAADGWTAPQKTNGEPDYSGCIARGKVNDMVRLIHPCMLRGSVERPLRFWTGEKRWLWDQDPEGKSLKDQGLDELDRMSVELHRAFRAEAKRRAKHLHYREELSLIRESIPQDAQETWQALEQYAFVLEQVRAGAENYTRQYKVFEGRLLDAVKGLPMEETIRSRIGLISYELFPAVEAAHYRDYKANDEKLVQQIPFILTFHRESVLGLALEGGKGRGGESRIREVASATVLCPQEIHYQVLVRPEDDIEELCDRLEAIVNYFGRRRAQSGVSLTAVTLDERRGEELRRALGALQERHPRKGSASWFSLSAVKTAADEAQAAEIFLEDLRGSENKSEESGNQSGVSLYDGSTALFASPAVSDAFRERVRQELPTCAFDSRSRRFVEQQGCSYLSGLHDRSSLRVRDLFALTGAREFHTEQPEFADDCAALWEICSGEGRADFTESVRRWSALCGALRRYEEGRPAMAEIALGAQGDDSFQERTSFLPAGTQAMAAELVRELVEKGVLGKQSLVERYTTDSCRALLWAAQAATSQIDKVMALLPFCQPDFGIRVQEDIVQGQRVVRICDNDPRVIGAELGATPSEAEKLHAVLQALAKRGFIAALEYDERTETASFFYTSPRMKRLLTTPQEILKIWTFYQVLESGYFDDVACGCRFSWREDGREDKLDLVLTEGFQSICVQCRADDLRQEEDDRRLLDICRHLGSAGVRILLGNVDEKKRQQRKVNHLENQPEHCGKEPVVYTISGEEKIRNIGRTLKDLMEERQQGAGREI